MRAKPQLRRAIQLVERLQSAKPERGKVGIVDKAFIQIAPVRRQNVHRCAPAFLVLIADLGGKINDRNDDANSAKHLPHRADHLPVHSCYFSDDSTNPRRRTSNIQRSMSKQKTGERGIRTLYATTCL